MLFIWILAYHSSLCVKNWTRTACRKDAVGVPTHANCCVALSPWDTFSVSDTWQGLGTSLLQGRILLGRHWIYERLESSLLQCEAAAPVCAKNQQERLIWDVEGRPKRYARATAPTKCVSWWLNSKMLWPAGFTRLHHLRLWAGSPRGEPPRV